MRRRRGLFPITDEMVGRGMQESLLPLLNHREMDRLVDDVAENHAKMMQQDWTPEQKQILVDNMAAVREAAAACRRLLNAVREKP